MTGFDAAHAVIEVGDDPRNRRKVVTIDDPTVFDGFLAGSTDPKPLFYRVTTFTAETAPQELLHIKSDIPGAGTTVRHPDLPAVILLPPGTNPGCLVCSVGLAASSTPDVSILLLLSFPIAVVYRRRGA